MSDTFAPAKSAARDDLLADAHTFGRLLGRSPAIRYVMRRLRAISAHDATLLLEG